MDRVRMVEVQQCGGHLSGPCGLAFSGARRPELSQTPHAPDRGLTGVPPRAARPRRGAASRTRPPVVAPPEAGRTSRPVLAPPDAPCGATAPSVGRRVSRCAAGATRARASRAESSPRASAAPPARPGRGSGRGPRAARARPARAARDARACRPAARRDRRPLPRSCRRAARRTPRASIVSRLSRSSEIVFSSSRCSARMSLAVWCALSTIRRISSSISRAISSE